MDEKALWIYAEARDGRVLDAGLELLGKGRDLASRARMVLCAVLMGHGIRALGQVLIDHGADRVYLCESPIFQEVFLHAEAEILSRMIRSYRPEIVLFGATSSGIQIAPRVAALVGTGLSAHCIDLEIDEEGVLRQIVPGFGGNLLATIVCPSHRPQMATIQPGVFQKPQARPREGETVEVSPDLPSMPSWPRIVEIQEEVPRETPLKTAEIVVAGGWGIGDREGWGLLEELAALLGGAVGATRPALDEGWAQPEQMIGQSGITVRPRYYIGVGISGAMHHMVGIQESGTIVAINSDPKVPIFQMCDLAVEGNYREILPLLIERIRGEKNR